VRLPRRSRLLWHRTEQTSPTGPCETCGRTGGRVNGRCTPPHAVAPQGLSHQTHSAPQSSLHGSEPGKMLPTQGRARSSPSLRPAASGGCCHQHGRGSLLLARRGADQGLRSARVTCRPTLGQEGWRATRSRHCPPRSKQNRLLFIFPLIFFFNKPSTFSLVLLGGRPWGDLIGLALPSRSHLQRRRSV